jgi:hypothetical protein
MDDIDIDEGEGEHTPSRTQEQQPTDGVNDMESTAQPASSSSSS